MGTLTSLWQSFYHIYVHQIITLYTLNIYRFVNYASIKQTKITSTPLTLFNSPVSHLFDFLCTLKKVSTTQLKNSLISAFSFLILRAESMIFTTCSFPLHFSTELVRK